MSTLEKVQLQQNEDHKELNMIKKIRKVIFMELVLRTALVIYFVGLCATTFIPQDTNTSGVKKITKSRIISKYANV